MGSSSSPILEPSPTHMKKQLIELFQESFRDDAIDGNQNIQERSKANPTSCPLSSKSTIKSLYGCVANFACSSEAIHNRSYNPGKGKFAKSARCCLSNLMCSLSFSGRRKRLILAGPQCWKQSLAFYCLYFKELVLLTGHKIDLKAPFSSYLAFFKQNCNYYFYFICG